MAPYVNRTKKRYKSNRARHRPMAEINVTPFVDVMLVLLIIFMVAAPLLTVGVPLELPKTTANPLPNERQEPLVISIKKDGEISIQNVAIEKKHLVNKLRVIALERANDKIYIRADTHVNYGLVMEIMGALNKADFNAIGLVTDTGGAPLDSDNH